MTTEERILIALVIGPMTSGQVAKCLQRSTQKVRKHIFVLRSQGKVMVNHINAFTTRKIPAYSLTAKGLTAAKELIS